MHNYRIRGTSPVATLRLLFMKLPSDTKHLSFLGS